MEIEWSKLNTKVVFSVTPLFRIRLENSGSLAPADLLKRTCSSANVLDVATLAGTFLAKDRSSFACYRIQSDSQPRGFHFVDPPIDVLYLAHRFSTLSCHQKLPRHLFSDHLISRHFYWRASSQHFQQHLNATGG